MPKLVEIADPVIMSFFVVADRDVAEKLKDHFGNKPIVMGGAAHLKEDEVEIDSYEGFSGAFNATFIVGKQEVDEDGDEEPMESIYIEELEE